MKQKYGFIGVNATNGQIEFSVTKELNEQELIKYVVEQLSTGIVLTIRKILE